MSDGERMAMLAREIVAWRKRASDERRRAETLRRERDELKSSPWVALPYFGVVPRVVHSGDPLVRYARRKR